MSRVEIAVALVASGVLVAAHESGQAGLVEAMAVALVVTGLVAVPLLTLAHELGHAVAALLLTRRAVVVRMGRAPFPVRFSIGRVALRYSPKGFVARCDLEDRGLQGGRLLLIALAGPGASVLTAAPLAILAMTLSGDEPAVWFWVAALAASASLILGLVNAIPSRRASTDGLLALRTLRSEGSNSQQRP